VATGCSGLPWGDDEAAEVAAVTAVKTSAAFTVPAKGYLEALSASPVAVPRVPTGALKVKDLVPEGSIVEAGQIVIVFDDTQLNIELGNHKASFRSANRRIDGNDLQSLIESGSIEVMKRVAELELDNAEQFGNLDASIYSRLEILESEVKKEEASETILFADASLLLRGEYYDIEERILDVEKKQVEGNIDRIETSLGSLVLKSPIGGLIVYKKSWRGASVAVGDTLWPGNVIMSIVDPDSTALTAFVLERDSAGVETGARAKVIIDAEPEREFEGKVTNVVEVTRPIERGSPVKYAEVRIELELDEPGLLKPGMKGEARIVTGEVEERVVLPRSALRGSPEQPFVMLAGESGPERREVKTGLGDLVRVSIEDGLAGGESVLLGGEEPETQPEQEPTPVEEVASDARAEA
jgi:multidrug efflux pump subunit AcrA (membrane-fusion protein)